MMPREDNYTFIFFLVGKSHTMRVVNQRREYAWRPRDAGGQDRLAIGFCLWRGENVRHNYFFSILYKGPTIWILAGARKLNQSLNS